MKRSSTLIRVTKYGYFDIISFYLLVPEYGPPNVFAVKRSSTSIKVTWGVFTDNTAWNGIGLGYEAQYRLKDATGNWTSKLLSGSSNRQHLADDLLKYRVYEFKVAARTSKGSGAFSSVVEERTMEDGKHELMR